MNQRGFTLIEALVALLVGTAVLFGISSFYVSALGFWRTSSSQTSLQRQGALILEEMAHQIRPGTISMTPLQTCSGVGQSLRVQNPNGTYCVRLDSAGGNQIVEDLPGGASLNMFSGSPVALTAAACSPATSFFTDPQNSANPPTATAVRVCFQLSDTSGNAMMFEAAITRRN